MRKLVSILLLSTLAPTALAASADGIWRTEANAENAFLEVTVGPCESDNSKTCGVITRALTEDGVADDYPHLGRVMIADMKDKGDGEYAGGRIWDPERDKEFKSTMVRSGNKLTVEGCVAFLCDGQTWTLVE